MNDEYIESLKNCSIGFFKVRKDLEKCLGFGFINLGIRFYLE